MTCFIGGEIAKAVNCISQSGGVVTYEDMANYQVELRKPLEVIYRNYSVLLNPAPSNGGILIALGLSRLNRKKLGQFQPWFFPTSFRGAEYHCSL